MPGAGSIPQSCRSAARAAQQLFFRGYGCVCSGAEAGLPPEKTALMSPEPFEDLLNQGKKDELLAWLKAFYLALKVSWGASAVFVRQLYCRMMQLLLQAADCRNLQISAPVSGSEMLEEAMEAETLDGLEELLSGYIARYFDGLEKLEGVSRTISNIIGVIAANYANPDLSIGTICKKLNLFSHSHVCVIFKAETGTTVNQYITNYRVEKAKALLQDGGAKLYAVASAVGYTDQNYFTKVFRKVAGLTPSEYREKH